MVQSASVSRGICYWNVPEAPLRLKENGSAEQKFEAKVISTLPRVPPVPSIPSTLFLLAPPWVWSALLSRE